MSLIYDRPEVNFQTVTMETHPFCNESVCKGVSQNYSVRTGGVEFLSSVETLRPLWWSTSTWELRVPSRHQVLEHLIASWIKHYTPSENGHQCLQSAGYTNPLSFSCLNKVKLLDDSACLPYIFSLPTLQENAYQSLHFINTQSRVEAYSTVILHLKNPVLLPF